MMAKKNPWIVSLRPNPEAALRLFCFPYAGGGASVFHRWLQHLPETVEVCSLQLPGRESRITESPFTDLSALAQAIGSVLGKWGDAPFLFYGHSVGALLCFEVTRELRRNGQTMPLCLYVSGCSAPHIPDDDPFLHRLPDQEFLERVRALNGTPQAIFEMPEIWEVFMPALRADFSLRGTYAYKADLPLHCSIAAFGGMDDPEVSHEHLEAWREHTTASFQIKMFPGDHFFLHTSQEPLLKQLSLELNQWVQKLTGPTTSPSMREASL